jgi:hypothetical protein
MEKGAAMAAKKMIPPGVAENAFGNDYDEFKLGISFRLQGGQVVMQFSDSVDRVRMAAGGARKLAKRLIEKATELDRLGAAAAPSAKAVRSKRRVASAAKT